MLDLVDKALNQMSFTIQVYNEQVGEKEDDRRYSKHGRKEQINW